MSNKTNIPNKTIEKAATIEKIWLEATTINILPGEEINFKIQEETNKELQPNNKKLLCSATVDEDGKAKIFFGSADIKTNNTTVKKDYFTKGWWSIDKAGDKPITRAIPGMLVYFHIETKDIPDGKKVALELYDDDNNEKEEPGSGDKDDHQKLVVAGTGIKISHKTVVKNKIVYAINLTNLENAIYNEIDKQLELYFRCSYNNVNVELPHSPKDYLVFGTLVIDRYKMPGLNASGTNIADDLTYGVGIKHSGSIYNNSEVSQYIKEYKELGFNETNHSFFSNIDSFDDKNRKAIYDKKEMYGVKVNNDYESGKDLKEFNEGKSPITNKWRDDDYLFWDFKNTAELYFARGELQTNLDKMIAKFKSNTGGIFEDTILTKYVNSHPNTNKYCLAVEDYISDRLKQDFKNDITKIEDKEPYFINTDGVFENTKGNRTGNHKKKITKPAYSYGGSGLIDKAKGIIDATKGLTIALNDIWATEVILTELNNDGDNYTVKYSVTLWDHFGLDIPDMQKNFNTYASVKEAFICWFVLQHLRGYKPFVTKITFEREFKGNFNQTGEERRKIKKAEDDAKWMRENKRAWDKATNPWAPGSKL